MPRARVRFFSHLPSLRLTNINILVDIPAILGMIRELALFEKALDRVEATESSLASTLSFAPDFSSGYAKTCLLYTSPSPRD